MVRGSVMTISENTGFPAEKPWPGQRAVQESGGEWTRISFLIDAISHEVGHALMAYIQYASEEEYS